MNRPLSGCFCTFITSSFHITRRSSSIAWPAQQTRENKNEWEKNTVNLICVCVCAYTERTPHSHSLTPDSINRYIALFAFLFHIHIWSCCWSIVLWICIRNYKTGMKQLCYRLCLIHRFGSVNHFITSSLLQRAAFHEATKWKENQRTHRHRWKRKKEKMKRIIKCLPFCIVLRWSSFISQIANFISEIKRKPSHCVQLYFINVITRLFYLCTSYDLLALALLLPALHRISAHCFGFFWTIFFLHFQQEWYKSTDSRRL